MVCRGDFPEDCEQIARQSVAAKPVFVSGWMQALTGMERMERGKIFSCWKFSGNH